jgi:hypothetical protein
MPAAPRDPIEVFFDSCTTLVFYGLESEDAKAGPSRPTLVLPSLNDPFRLFTADKCPYISVQPVSYFLEELETARKKAGEDPSFPPAIQKIESWLVDLKDPVIGYQLEPPALAGSGLATPHIETLIAQEDKAKEDALALKGTPPTEEISLPKSRLKRYFATPLFVAIVLCSWVVGFWVIHHLLSFEPAIF